MDLKRYQEFNHIPTAFANPKESLNKKEQNTLLFFETRSRPQNGDTKIYDTTACKVLQISRATLQRHLSKFEKMGYINRLCHKYQTQYGTVRSDRVIRCNRVFLSKGCKPAKQEDLKWKHDPRPAFDRKRIIEKGSTRLIDNLFLQDDFLLNSFKLNYPAIQLKQQSRCNISITEEGDDTFFHKLMDRKNYGDKNAMLWLGKNPPKELNLDYGLVLSDQDAERLQGTVRLAETPEKDWITLYEEEVQMNKEEK